MCQRRSGGGELRNGSSSCSSGRPQGLASGPAASAPHARAGSSGLGLLAGGTAPAPGGLISVNLSPNYTQLQGGWGLSSQVEAAAEPQCGSRLEDTLPQKHNHPHCDCPGLMVTPPVLFCPQLSRAQLWPPSPRSSAHLDAGWMEHTHTHIQSHDPAKNILAVSSTPRIALQPSCCAGS